MNDSIPTLYQLRYSMFPEMARWALDYKQVAHRRISLLPGPHAPTVIKLAGQTSMPVLVHNGTVIKDSDKVLDYIESNWPESPLYPSDPELRQLAIEIRDRFRGWGADFRRAYFFELLKDKDHAAATFSQGRPAASQLKYRRHFWVVNLIMIGTMGVTSGKSKASLKVIEEGLDWLEANINQHGFLVGEQFTIADLTAATVLGVVCLAENTPPAPAQPLAPAVAKWKERWANRPAVTWANEIYAKYRPKSAAIEELQS